MNPILKWQTDVNNFIQSLEDCVRLEYALTNRRFEALEREIYRHGERVSERRSQVVEDSLVIATIVESRATKEQVIAVANACRDATKRHGYEQLEIEIGKLRELWKSVEPVLVVNALEEDGSAVIEPKVWMQDIDQPGATRKSPEKWLAEAMLLLRDNPDWSDARIAKKVNVNKSTLSRSETYQNAKAMWDGQKLNVRAGHVTTDSVTGMRDIEAYDSDDPADCDLD